MKIVCAVFLAALLVARVDAQQQPAPVSRHQWVELTLRDGRRVLCDLAHVDNVYVGETTVKLNGWGLKTEEGQTPIYLYETGPDPALRKALADAILGAPERWFLLGWNPASYDALNLDTVAAIYFGTDDKGPYAQVITRHDSIFRPPKVKDKNPAAPDPNAGIKRRDPEAIARLKALAKQS